MSGYGGGARWNDATQSWEPVQETQAPGGPVPPQPPSASLQPLPLRPPPPPAPPSYDPTAVPSPGPVPGPVPGSGRSRHAVVAGVVAAVLAAGGVGGWLVWGGDGDGKGTAGPPAVTSTATDGPGPSSGQDSGTPSDPASPSGGPAATDREPPPGFHTVEDPEGFTIAVPVNWNRTSSATEGVFYHSPDGKSLVQIFTLAAPGTPPYESLRQTSGNLAAKPGYQELSLERTGPGDAAELVYAYDREEGRRKVVDRAFTGTDGRQHAILVAGPETDWPQQRGTLTTALEFFRP